MAASMVESLSRMEKEILVFVLGRYSDIQTAQALDISPHTVKKHVGHALMKLGYPNRKALLRSQ